MSDFCSQNGLYSLIFLFFFFLAIYSFYGFALLLMRLWRLYLHVLSNIMQVEKVCVFLCDKSMFISTLASTVYFYLE